MADHYPVPQDGQLPARAARVHSRPLSAELGLASVAVAGAMARPKQVHRQPLVGPRARRYRLERLRLPLPMPRPESHTKQPP
jgi:hypothetical protein